MIKSLKACVVNMLMAACVVNLKHKLSLFLPAVVRHSSSSLLSWQLSWPLHKKLRSTQLPFRHLKRVSEHNSGLPVVKESGQRECHQCQKHKRHSNHWSTFISVYSCQIHFNKIWNRDKHIHLWQNIMKNNDPVKHVIWYLVVVKTPMFSL